MRALLLVFLCLGFSSVFAQEFSTEPAFPTAEEPLTITIDLTGTSLENEPDVWIWAFLPDLNPVHDAPTNVNPATEAQSAAKFTATGQANEFTITFTPTAFFDKPAEEITRIGFLAKGRSFTDGQTQDLFIEVSTGELEVSFSQPSETFDFVDLNEEVTIAANASSNASLELFFNGSSVATTTGTQLSYTTTIDTPGSIQVAIEAEEGGATATDEFTLIVKEEKNEPRPSGIIPGINYDADPTIATFCLYAPLKESVYLVGDFNNWTPTAAYQMAKDGDFFWLTVNQLVAGQEYAFQYLIDETLLVGDPYADKILDPNNDGFIPETNYPNLKAYPTSDVPDGWVSVMQTDQQPYNWSVNDFQPPQKEDLVIYELLIRDFDDDQNYQSVIDRLDYLEDLGINAIQLMPVMEFDGNNSWGYNPAYFFAPDKYYGTKNDLKAFIDECHARGMAVILDMVLNHTHERNPLAWMYWDQSNFRPAANSPYLNQQATHPFNVFFDFNHESEATQAFVDTVNYYWLEEYRFDGYRFDLSKGFTQTNTGSNVEQWSAYDQSRIDLLTRMADEIWTHHPEAYVILEHLSTNSEEKVLADYGMMLWGNMNFNFNQNTMGFADGSNLDWAHYATRDWNDPHLIPYMESHDEERLVYRNLQSGNNSGGHNTRNLDVALERVKAASAIYYGIPGPKMLWQFGELGYDLSINRCPDGSINNDCRVDEKPVPWAGSEDNLSYDTDEDRAKLYTVTSLLMKLKTSAEAFSNSAFTLDESQPLVKKLTLDTGNDNPQNATEANFVIVANFNMTPTTVSLAFPHGGMWYHYLANGDALDVSANPQEIVLMPGEFRVYSDVQLEAVEAELTQFVQPLAPTTLAITEVMEEGVEITWADNSDIETSYAILKRVDGVFEEIAVVGENVSSYLDTEVSSNTSYIYKVVARNAVYSTESEELEFTTTNVITSIEGGDYTFFVYPNPATDLISFKGVVDGSIVEIRDLTGRVHLKSTVESDQLDISQLASGIYLLTVEYERQLRLIKY